MRRNKKSRILAVLLAVSLSGSSAVYAQAEEVNNPDPDIEICGEEHEMKEVQVVEPTCTEAGYVLWKCSSCDYEEKRDLKKALGHDLEVVSTEEATEDTPGKVVYKCKREKCDYTETNIISVKEPGTDGKEDNKDNDKDNNREKMKSRMVQLIRTKMIRRITMVRQSRIPEMNPTKILIRQRNQRLTKKNSRMWMLMKNMQLMLLPLPQKL